MEKSDEGEGQGEGEDDENSDESDDRHEACQLQEYEPPGESGWRNGPPWDSGWRGPAHQKIEHGKNLGRLLEGDGRVEELEGRCLKNRANQREALWNRHQDRMDDLRQKRGRRRVETVVAQNQRAYPPGLQSYVLLQLGRRQRVPRRGTHGNRHQDRMHDHRHELGRRRSVTDVTQNQRAYPPGLQSYVLLQLGRRQRYGMIAG